MSKKFEITFAALCITAALLAAVSVAYRVISQDAAGREAAKADFEGLRSALAYVKSPSDLADAGLRARLASRYEASAGLLLVDVYEQGDGDRWRIPDESLYLGETGRGGGAPGPSYPPSSTMLLSAPLKGDSTGKLAVDALYVSLPQEAAFAAFRDALIALGAFIAVAAFVLAVATGRKAGKGEEATFDFSGSAAANESAGARASGGDEQELFADQWDVADKATAAARYQFETLSSGSGGAGISTPADEEFDIPVMDPEAPDKPEELSLNEWPMEGEPAAIEDAAAARPGSETPEGLFSPASGLGWEPYLKERLDAELSRSASFEQDLSLLVLCHDELSPHDGAYSRIAATIKGFFSFRDLAFERYSDGFSIILPNIDSAHAIRMADEFFKKLVFLADGDFAELDLMPIYLGISSRAGRLVDAKRMIDEAAAALDRARYEKDTHIVAFRPDPDKYRQFLTAKAVG